MQLNIFSSFLVFSLLSFNLAFANVDATNGQSPQGTNDVPNYRLNATTLAQLEELKEQIKSLRGEIEQLQFDNSRLNEKIVKFSADTEYRFSELSKAANKAEGTKSVFSDIDEALDNDVITEESDAKKASSIKKETSHPKDAASTKNEQEEYDDAYYYIKQKKYKDAQDAFKLFVDKYSDTDLAGNAYYWLGEIQFMKKAYDKSAVEYLKGYQASIRGSRAADNLLKLGKSLAKLEKRKEACTTFLKLKKEFPKASNQIKKQNDEEIKNLHCS